MLEAFVSEVQIRTTAPDIQCREGRCRYEV